MPTGISARVQTIYGFECIGMNETRSEMVTVQAHYNKDSLHVDSSWSVIKCYVVGVRSS